MTSPITINPFYHSTLRNLVISFGKLFNNMTVSKKLDDGSDGDTLRVPIAYGPKDKWLSRLNEQPEFTKGIQITLPRLSFEIMSITPDPGRTIGSRLGYTVGRLGASQMKIGAPVPYNVNINLYSIAKDQTTSFQIMEQILPYFRPFMTLEIETLPEFRLTKDVHISLGGVQSVDNYEGSPQELRYIVQTFGFTAPIDLYGPLVENRNVIKDVKINFDTEVPSPLVMPDNAGQYEATVNPFTAKKEDDWTVDEFWRNL